jgi:hydroxyquinol 1,2-dioxygenase
MEEEVRMTGRTAVIDSRLVVDQLRARLRQTRPGRLSEAVQMILNHAFVVMAELRPSADELDQLVEFLTAVGDATNAQRQEWVLLADIFGLSSHLCDCADVAAGVTPSVLRGPFYRPDAPLLQQGANLSRDGVGVPMTVAVSLRDIEGRPLAGAELEVWHANRAGLYENQDPDNQPEHNLRGRFIADRDGLVAFRTIRPGGYRLPDDGPVGQLARALGLSLDRPAHLHFAVSMPGYRRLVTAVFDGSDPAIGRDALYSVKPELIARLAPTAEGFRIQVVLVLARDLSLQSDTTPRQEG